MALPPVRLDAGDVENLVQVGSGSIAPGAPARGAALVGRGVATVAGVRDRLRDHGKP